MIIWHPSISNLSAINQSRRGWLACRPCFLKTNDSKSIQIAKVYLNDKLLSLNPNSYADTIHWLNPGDCLRLGDESLKKFIIWTSLHPNTSGLSNFPNSNLSNRNDEFIKTTNQFESFMKNVGLMQEFY